MSRHYERCELIVFRLPPKACCINENASTSLKKLSGWHPRTLLPRATGRTFSFLLPETCMRIFIDMFGHPNYPRYLIHWSGRYWTGSGWTSDRRRALLFARLRLAVEAWEELRSGEDEGTDNDSSSAA